MNYLRFFDSAPPSQLKLLTRPTKEFNPCHEPAGSSKGGEFAPKGSGQCEPKLVRRASELPPERPLVRRASELPPKGSAARGTASHPLVYEHKGGRLDLDDVVQRRIPRQFGFRHLKVSQAAWHRSRRVFKYTLRAGKTVFVAIEGARLGDFRLHKVTEANPCHEPAGSPRGGGRFARKGEGVCDGSTKVGITSFRKPEQYAETPKGTTTGRRTYQRGRNLSVALRYLPEVTDIRQSRARGAWVGGREPSWALSYTGNGKARRLLAEIGQQDNQDGIFFMYPATGPLPTGAKAQATLIHELIIPGGVRRKVREALEESLKGDIPSSGWTWVKRGGDHVLRIVRVPQWADETATPEVFARAARGVERLLRDGGRTVRYRTQPARVETVMHERAIGEWASRERGNQSYEDVLGND